MFDHFDNRRRIKVRQSLVAIDQRSVQQLDPFRLAFWNPVKVESALGVLQRPNRNIHTDNSVKLPVGEQVSQQLAFPASEVQHCEHRSLRMRQAQFPAFVH